jgi:hypothetical protein
MGCINEATGVSVEVFEQIAKARALVRTAGLALEEHPACQNGRMRPVEMPLPSHPQLINP